MSTTSRNRLSDIARLLAVVGLSVMTSAQATGSYYNPGPFVVPLLHPTAMPGLPTRGQVSGKEYTDAGAPSPLAQQVVDWDGYHGGTINGLNYTGNRPAFPGGGNIDALANFYDTLLFELKNDRVHLIFSVSATMRGDSGLALSVPSDDLTGSVIGGAGELSYELAGDPSYEPVGDLAPGRQGVWASRAEINADVLPVDVDGLELWGPEPTSGVLGDANKYSLESDYASFDTAIDDDAVSVWNANGTPFVPHSMIVNAVTSPLLLGVPEGITVEDLSPLVDVDALMVHNMPGASPNTFDAETRYGPDMILFSIAQIQIADPLDPTRFVYYATGSEIFWLAANGDCGFLHHGGHDWDTDYALASLTYSTDGGTGVLDLDALEAVSAPEPTAAVLVLVAIFLLGLRVLGRRRQA